MIVMLIKMVIVLMMIIMMLIKMIIHGGNHKKYWDNVGPLDL